MRSTLRRLARRHTTAVAYLALFAALGGSAYAAVTVTGKQIKDGTVTGKDVKNRSLGAAKLSAGALGRNALEVRQTLAAREACRLGSQCSRSRADLDGLGHGYGVQRA